MKKGKKTLSETKGMHSILKSSSAAKDERPMKIGVNEDTGKYHLVPPEDKRDFVRKEQHIALNEVWIRGSGGNTGCTNKINMENIDFVLTLNNKEYRFGTDIEGNLAILCINGVDEKIDVFNGYKRLRLITDSTEFPVDYEQMMSKENLSIEDAKKCKECLDNQSGMDCSFAVRGSFAHPPFCIKTGDAIISGKLESCPYKK